MRREVAKLLEDIRDALEHLLTVTGGKTLADYEGDRNLQLITERLFEIVGEALIRLKRTAPALAANIPEIGKIIGFRNILAHGYDVIDNIQVWDIVSVNAPELLRIVQNEMKTED